jgi:hypothetical protein
MRILLLTACVWFAGLMTSMPAQARTAPAAVVLRPRPIVQSTDSRVGPASTGANLVLFGSRGANFTWSGRGAATRDIPVCISTPTGRYRLTISSLSGGAANAAAKIPYTFQLKDSAGTAQVATTEHSQTVSFDGAAPASADCLSGPNATLTITLEEQHLFSGIAGNYADNLQFAVQSR